MSPRLPLLLIGASALSACATMGIAEAPPGPPRASAADAHEISVEQTAERLEVAVAAENDALSAAARQDISALAGNYLRYGHGPLIVSVPEGGTNAATAARAANLARTSLIESGVSYAAIATSGYDASGDADPPVILSFERYEAHAPECAPLWEQDLAHQSDNRPWDSFGCATQANLAALVEDPRDLLRPRTEDPRDSNRRSTVFQAYREGEPTHAERSSDERVTISNVAR